MFSLVICRRNTFLIASEKLNCTLYLHNCYIISQLYLRNYVIFMHNVSSDLMELAVIHVHATRPHAQFCSIKTKNKKSDMFRIYSRPLEEVFMHPSYVSL